MTLSTALAFVNAGPAGLAAATLLDAIALVDSAFPDAAVDALALGVTCADELLCDENAPCRSVRCDAACLAMRAARL